MASAHITIHVITQYRRTLVAIVEVNLGWAIQLILDIIRNICSALGAVNPHRAHSDLFLSKYLRQDV